MNWLLECLAVQNTYRAWRVASASDEPIAFDAYRAALDREEGAARIYAHEIRRSGRLDETGLAWQLAQSRSRSTV
jgi:hypothetical protein